MKGKMIIIAPGEPRQEREYENATIPLEDLQKAVGGFIEIVPYFSMIGEGGSRTRCVVFCNEDGKRLQLPLNHVANDLWNRELLLATGSGLELDYLVGSIAIVWGDDEFMESM